MPLNTLDLDTLRTLVVATDLGGYGQAAARLDRTPSAISLQMKRLQDDVGAALFRKQGRSLALTEMGEIVLRYARRMVALNDEMLHTVRGASIAGTARLGLCQDFAESVLPEVLARFTALYPMVQVEVRIDGNAPLVRALEQGELDLVLALGQAEKPTAEQLGEVPLVWIAGREFTPRPGQSLPLVVFGATCTLRQRAVQALDAAGTGWNVALVSPSLAGLWAGASAGLGVTVRTELACPPHLVAGATLFDLPSLGTLPVTLHRAPGGRPPAVDRLAEITSTIVADSLAESERRG